MKTQELNHDEQKATSGGSFLGTGLLNDDNIISDLAGSKDYSNSSDGSNSSHSSGSNGYSDSNSGRGSLLDL